MRTRRNLILKARQKGISKVIDADQLIDCLRKPTAAVVISHEHEATKRMFRAVKYFIDNLSMPVASKIDSANEITFSKTNSSYYIGTAGQKAFGRGDTIHRAHLSEAAFYQDLQRILTGVQEAAEYGQIDIESTPNGRGNLFYEMWRKAREGKSAYTPIFIPWFIDNEYSVDNMTAEEINGLSGEVRQLLLTPDNELVYNDSELELLARVKKEWGFSLTPGQIKWRRYKLYDLADRFYQEYPEDEVSCFLQSGRPVFTSVTLRTEAKIALDNLTPEQLADIKKRRLYAGLDGAEGSLGGDKHCLAVIDVMAAPAKVIFEINSNEPIEVFTQRVANLLKLLPNIELTVEKNGVGAAHCLNLKRLGVRFNEWTTTSANRPVIITDLETAYRTGQLIESYSEAYNELLDMFYDNFNRPIHPQGKHDDRVFARALAWQGRYRPLPSIV